MRKGWHNYGRMAFILVCVALFLVMGGTAVASPFIQIDLLTVNDFHGAVAESGKNPGAAKLATFIKSEQAKNKNGTIILSAGDMFQGSFESNIVQGKTVVDVMNMVGFRAMALGNHEFDWGEQVLRERGRQAKFLFLAANVKDRVTGHYPEGVLPYVIIEKQDIKIGIIGLATPETAEKANPKIVGRYLFEKPVSVVGKLIPELKKLGADIIVVLSHLGCEPSEKKQGEYEGEAIIFAKKIKGVDALVTGHSHKIIATNIAGIPVVQAAYNGRAVGKISLLYSKIRKKVLMSTVNVLEVDPAKTNPDQAVVKMLATLEPEISAKKNTVVGSSIYPLSHDRKRLSVQGQWATDAIRKAAHVDIALQNGGGVRTSLPNGIITLGHVYETMPFDNTVMVGELTGKQVKKILEYGIANEKFGMLQFSGLKVTFNAIRPLGHRIVSVKMADGKDLEPSHKYLVAANDFMFAGGDGYTMLKDAKNIKDTYMLLRDVLMQTFIDNKIIDFNGDERLNMIAPTQQNMKKPAA